MDRRVNPAETSQKRSITDHGFDATDPYRFDRCLGSESVDIEPRRHAPDLERKMGITAADEREVTVCGERFDLSTVLRMFPVDFDRIEGGIACSKETVPKRVGDDRRTVVGVGEVDGLRGR